MILPTKPVDKVNGTTHGTLNDVHAKNRDKDTQDTKYKQLDTFRPLKMVDTAINSSSMYT